MYRTFGYDCRQRAGSEDDDFSRCQPTSPMCVADSAQHAIAVQCGFSDPELLMVDGKFMKWSLHNNKGHFGASHVILLCREVVLFLEVYSYGNNERGCLFLRESFIGGSFWDFSNSSFVHTNFVPL